MNSDARHQYTANLYSQTGDGRTGEAMANPAKGSSSSTEPASNVLICHTQSSSQDMREEVPYLGTKQTSEPTHKTKT